jgi:predicted aldo/keto reductase-like oxidoreductase
VEASLKSLRTDYVDILLAHSLKTPKQVNSPELIDFMETMKKEGKARFTGFSSHSNMATLLKAAAKAGGHDVALVSYNFTHSNDLKDAIAAAAEAGIGIVAMKTQAGGYKKSKMKGLSPHQAALKYVIMDRNVATTVPGVTTIEQMAECFAVMGTAFSKGDSTTLEHYNAFLQGRICTMCGGCTGDCPHGVHHTDILRVVMYHDGYKNNNLIQEAFLDGDILEKSSRCSECSSCSIICRRGLDIRAQIEQVKRVLA